MTIFAEEISDEVREQIDEYVSENSKFKRGDKVTIPHEDYHNGGYLMTIEEAIWTPRDLIRTKEQTGMGEFTHISELMDSYDPERDFGDFYVCSVSYIFEDESFHMESESSLIPWTEYDGRMKLPSNGEYSFKYVEEEDCEVCGCNRHIVSGFDNGVVGGHQKYCPVCDNVTEVMTP